MTNAELIQVILTGVLVAITGIYVWRTFVISKAAARQADASMKMAKEMRLQRLEAKPFVVPDICNDYGVDNKDIAIGTFPLSTTNVGTAAAVELELSLRSPSNKPLSDKLPLLLAGDDWQIRFSYTDEFDEKGEPIFGLPPPEGLYELKVTFRSATSHPDSQPSEVILPIELHWSGEGPRWNIKRHKLIQKLAEA